MKLIRYRFYSARAATKDGRKMSLVEWLIDLRSELTHVETQFDENRDYVSWSSTGAEGANGCRFRDIGYSHEKYWFTLSFLVTDEEERRLWEFCCDGTCMPYNWQGIPTLYNGLFWQGPNHIKYDYIGLLTFALEKSPSWKTNLLRAAFWSWTKIVRPDPKKMWCSECCSKGWNEMKQITDLPYPVPKSLNYCFWPTEIDPGQMYEIMRTFNGARKGE